MPALHARGARVSARVGREGVLCAGIIEYHPYYADSRQGVGQPLMFVQRRQVMAK